MGRLIPIVCNQLATLLIGLAGLTILTHVVPKDVYALYVLFMTLTQVGYLLTHSGLVNHSSRYWQRESVQSGAYARFLWRASWQASRVLAVLLFAWSLALAFYSQNVDWVWIFPILFGGNVACALFTIAHASLNAGGRLWPMCFLGVAANGTRALLPPLFALAMGVSLAALCVGFAVHSLVIVLSILLLFREGWTTCGADVAIEAKWRHELRVFGRPFVLMGIGSWLLLNADRWIVAIFFGQARTADFGLASSIAAIVPNLVCAGLLQLVFPAVFRQADAAQSEKDWRQLARRCDGYSLLLIMVTVLGLLGLWLMGPYLVGALISDRYAASMPLLFPAAWRFCQRRSTNFSNLLLQGQHNSLGMVKAMVTISGLKTLGSMLLLPYPGRPT